ncbi:virulence-associated protein E [Burkholderia pseudomallei]|nr:virulence-associated protein E [Burkholderia pseudomallei]CAJ4275506.1 virulence-associated protein E [Burkholderia pseudomallei]
MIAWNEYPVGSHRARCPACGRRERDKTLGITIEANGTGIAHCFRCAFVETHRPERGAHLTSRRTLRINAALPSAKRDTLSNYGRELWGACSPLSGVALAYLEARCCRIPPAAGDLRWHPALAHPVRHVGPALVALVTHAVTGEHMTLHRTWVKPDGTKADVYPPRLLLAGHPKQGGVIRLWPDEAVTSGLGIAEGIETALSLAHGYAPVWSCLDAGNLAALPVLPGIENLVIGTDNDEAGRASAHACASRWAEAGWEAALVEVPYGT